MSEAGSIGFLLLCGLPLAGAVLAGLLRGRLSDGAAVLFSAVTAAAGCVLVLQHGVQGVSTGTAGFPFLDRMVGRPVPLFGFTLDPLSSMVVLGAVIIGFVCILYSIAYVGPRNREAPVTDDRRVYHFWMLLFIGAMAGLATSTTLFQLFIFWEITTVCSWALIGFYDEESGARKAARKAFLMTTAGGLCLFGGLLALIALTGSAGFDAFGQLPDGVRAGAVLLAVLLLLGAWAKSAQFPFHTWLPSAMAAPSPVSAYLHAASMVNAGVYLVLRLVLANARTPLVGDAGGSVFSLDRIETLLPSGTGLVIGIMAVLTLVIAVVQFFNQDDLKRLLALSTIGHLSLILLGGALAVAGSLRAAQGATLHILAHGVGKALLFLSVGVLSYGLGTRRIRDLSGVLRSMPVPAVGFLVGLLTVTGVPPFAGFWSKLLIITGAVELGGMGTAAGVLVVAESVIAFAWMLWVGQRVFLGNPSPAAGVAAVRSAPMEAALVVLMVLSLAVTLVALPLARSVQLASLGG